MIRPAAILIYELSKCWYGIWLFMFVFVRLRIVFFVFRQIYTYLNSLPQKCMVGFLDCLHIREDISCRHCHQTIVKQLLPYLIDLTELYHIPPSPKPVNLRGCHNWNCLYFFMCFFFPLQIRFFCFFTYMSVRVKSLFVSLPFDLSLINIVWNTKYIIKESSIIEH